MITLTDTSSSDDDDPAVESPFQPSNMLPTAPGQQAAANRLNTAQQNGQGRSTAVARQRPRQWTTTLLTHIESPGTAARRSSFGR